MPFPEITPEDAGCWLDGVHGWHNNHRVVDLAGTYGLSLGPDDQALVDRYRAHGDHDEAAAAAMCDQGGIVDRATDHLNSLAPDGYTFIWEAAELTLLPEQELQP